MSGCKHSHLFFANPAPSRAQPPPREMAEGAGPGAGGPESWRQEGIQPPTSCRRSLGRGLHFLVAQTVTCLPTIQPGFNNWVGKISWTRKKQPTPVSLPGESHGQRRRAGYRAWGCKESDTTEATEHKNLNKLQAGQTQRNPHHDILFSNC